MFSDSVMYTNITDNYTVSGHVVGMLDRDQRTAKLRCDCYCQSAMFLVFHSQNSHYYYVHPRDTISKHEKVNHRHLLLKRKSSRSTRSRKNSYLWNTLRRLKQALIAGIYLLSLVSVPCSLSAPTNIRHMADRKETPKWINPCGIKDDYRAVHDMNTQIPIVSDSDLLTQILTQANAALTNAVQFKEDYAQSLYKTDYKQYHENWKETEYDWLPQREDLHKGLNESIPVEHLENLKLDDTLLDAYHYLQMIAVGLEQVVWDQEEDDGPFLRNFNESQFHLRLVLCEIQMAIYERGIHGQMKPDVDRDSMPDYLRVRDENNSTARNLRDWIIYRDYMNALEYVKEVFQYLKNKL